jgi:predicted nucleic acid-binding OB-fold protein
MFSSSKKKAEVEEIKSDVLELIPEAPKPVEKLEKIVTEKKVPEEKQKITRLVRQKDLFSYLKRKEMKKIVSFIFANDEEDFTNTAERIMDCHSYKEASEILKAVFTSYKISPYSKEAITFTNAVSNYFRQA